MSINDESVPLAARDDNTATAGTGEGAQIRNR
jgi:hypothetical protein